MDHVDVFISGGGIAGLVAAAALADLGHRVLVADPTPQRIDQRSTAYLVPSRDLLRRVGLWEALASDALPLDALRIVDTIGWPPSVTETVLFTPEELTHAHFGWNIPNARAREVLLDRLREMPGVTLRTDAGFAGLLTRTSEARVQLTDGTRLCAQLVIGADGRASPVREALGIPAQIHRYGQKALAFAATHSLPHGNVSTEIYNQGGAFTTVPLPDRDGRPCSAIVWMMDGPEAVETAGLSDDAFNAKMTTRAAGLLGPMSRLATPDVWPVVTQVAQALTAERSLLLAEAAHVLPPIGAQGLNTSLRDVAVLRDVVRDRPETPLGSPEQLARYAKARGSDTHLRASAIDLFNRVCQSGAAPVQSLRSFGLRATGKIAPLRLGLMKAGMGG